MMWTSIKQIFPSIDKMSHYLFVKNSCLCFKCIRHLNWNFFIKKKNTHTHTICISCQVPIDIGLKELCQVFALSLREMEITST